MKVFVIFHKLYFFCIVSELHNIYYDEELLCICLHQSWKYFLLRPTSHKSQSVRTVSYLCAIMFVWSNIWEDRHRERLVKWRTQVWKVDGGNAVIEFMDHKKRRCQMIVCFGIYVHTHIRAVRSIFRLLKQMEVANLEEKTNALCAKGITVYKQSGFMDSSGYREYFEDENIHNILWLLSKK